MILWQQYKGLSDDAEWGCQEITKFEWRHLWRTTYYDKLPVLKLEVVILLRVYIFKKIAKLSAYEMFGVITQYHPKT